VSKRIVATAVRLMREANQDILMWGDLDLLDAIGSACEFERMHPLKRHAKILNALDANVRGKNPAFDKLYIRLDTFRNDQSRNVRAFRLIKQEVKHGIENQGDKIAG
jgi:hypothetical protein